MNFHSIKKRILVVDDDDDFLALVINLLSQEGYEAKGISNGLSIVEGTIEWPDLFILDKQMEFIDGIAISKFLRMRQDAKHIPIIMLSAGSNRQHAAKAGVDFYLEKPFKANDLLNIVAQCLASSENNELVHS